MTDLTLSIAEAANQLGISQHAVRRRIKSGELAAVRVERPQGHQWRIPADQLAPGAPPSPPNAPPDNLDQIAPPDGPPPSGRTAGPPTQNHSRAANLDSIVTILQSERRRTLELENERAELYGRLGYLQAELGHARQQIALLTAAGPPATVEVEGGTSNQSGHLDNSPVRASQQAPRRAWWQFW